MRWGISQERRVLLQSAVLESADVAWFWALRLRVFPISPAGFNLRSILESVRKGRLMSIFENAERPRFAISGLENWALAGFRDGLRGIDVSLKKIAVGGATPVHYHDCEEVVVVLAGVGRATIGDEPCATFGAESTLVVPTGVVHQFENAGEAAS